MGEGRTWGETVSRAYFRGRAIMKPASSTEGGKFTTVLES